jgi:hypothetical protein
MRRALAERIADAYTAVGAEAVLLGGSTGRGEADLYSDIELGVFWTREPSERERESAIARAGGDLHRLFPFAQIDRAWFDEWFVGRRGGVAKSGVLVEPVHMTIADARATIEDVLERFDPALEKQVLLAAVCDGVPLAGDELLAPWREAGRAYPEGLARAVVERHTQVDHFWRFGMFRERGNPMQAARATADVHERVLHALLAVNRVYWYGFKSLESVIRRFAIAPEALLDRIRRTYEVEDAERERLLVKLVEETYDLVERHVPGVDVDRLRTIFRYRRTLWDDEAPVI